MARILLVEDDPDVRPLLEHFIFADGHHVTPAENLTVGAKLLGSQPFDLLVTDVNLPDGSGLALADRAKAANIKTLVITGHGLKLAPGKLSAYNYLLKPVRAHELTAAIKHCLSQQDEAPKAN
jgi:DNA-binding NtrC family response regulator